MTEKLTREDFMEQMKVLRQEETPKEETPEERKKRKQREYSRRYAEKKKAEKAAEAVDAAADPEQDEPINAPESGLVLTRLEAAAVAWVIDKAFIMAVQTGTEMDMLRVMELMHIYSRACVISDYAPGGE